MKEFCLFLFAAFLSSIVEKYRARRYLIKMEFEGGYPEDGERNRIFRQTLRKYREEYYGK